MNKSFTRMQRGFTLIELLVIVIIIGIIAAITIPNLIKTKQSQINSLQRLRLTEYARAQDKFRLSGRRRYATIKELCAEGLLSDTVAKFDSSCTTQETVNGWTIQAGTETTAFLQDHYFASLKYDDRPSGDQTPVACVAQDSVVRLAAAASVDTCTTSSTAYQP